MFKGIEKLRIDLENQGLPINNTQIAVKLGHEILEGNISMDISLFNKNKKKNTIDLGGLMNVKIKRKQEM